MPRFTYFAPGKPGGALLVLAALFLAAAPAKALDLTHAVVVSPPGLSGPERKAVAMLIEEVQKRTQIRWEQRADWPSGEAAVIAVGPASALPRLAGAYAAEVPPDGGLKLPEAFRIRTRRGSRGSAVLVVGDDARGVLFGVGRLLRELRMRPTAGADPAAITLPDDLNVTTAPKYPLRGHQLGYRPKTNSYDAWDLPVWEQYIRDLAVFGANAIELIPPRSDDDLTSPLMPRPPMEMMIGMSQLAADYGLDVWIWYPAMDKDYSDPKTVEFALNEWGEVFKKLPRIDAVFVPGGDPGHTEPKYLLALLEKQTALLHQFHPRAQMWVSPQSFNEAWMAQFLEILNQQLPAWLSGVVYGPQVRMSLPKLRAAVPARYPIRHYPDITHSLRCEYPVPNWYRAYAFTEGRETINPRPVDEAAIFRFTQADTIGFLTYSEGCNDDVNKTVWSALGWNPDADVVEVLREYSRYFIGDRYTDDFAQGLLALERNWRGPLAANEGVGVTLQQFQAMERNATPGERRNWRFLQGLYRAYYDAYTRSRLIYELGLEERAMVKLRQTLKVGSLEAMNGAQQILLRATSDRIAPDWRGHIVELADGLFHAIGMQLSVSRHMAKALDRGANLDALDFPLNNRVWLEEEFAKVRIMPFEPDRDQRLGIVANWTDPGPGGFYDDLGDLANQPHLIRGTGEDPAGLTSSSVGFIRRQTGRSSWWDHAESLYESPLIMRYAHLDPAASYKVRVVYGGDHPKKPIRLVANDKFEIHGFREKEVPFRPVEFDIPHAATAKGELTLAWTREPGLGDDGRGCQVAEVWLIKK